MQIENKQYIDKIEQRSAELLQLKMTTGKTVQVHPRQNCLNVGQCVKTDHVRCTFFQALNAKKKELSELIKKTNSHKQEIAARKDQLQKVRLVVQALLCLYKWT